MSTNRGHHISKTKKFEVLLVPQGDAGQTKSFSTSISRIVFIVAAFVSLIVASVALLAIYTPVGRFLPVSDFQMQNRFGHDLVDLQTKLAALSEEVIVLREYNIKLRTALGAAPDSNGTKDADSTGRIYSESDPVSVENDISFPAAAGSFVKNDSNVPFRALFPLTAPVMGYISRGYDEVIGHYAVDYAANSGAIVTAAVDGYVIFTGWTYEDGNVILLSHGGGFSTAYKHNQVNLKSIGEFVKRGAPVALLGNSGRSSTGPHLHFELWKDGQPQNPLDFIVAAKSS